MSLTWAGIRRMCRIGTVTKYDVFENGASKSGRPTDRLWAFQACRLRPVTSSSHGGCRRRHRHRISAERAARGDDHCSDDQQRQYYSPLRRSIVERGLHQPCGNLGAIRHHQLHLAFIQSSGVDSTTHIPMIGWGGSTTVGGPITNDGGITAEGQPCRWPAAPLPLRLAGRPALTRRPPRIPITTI